MASNPPAELIEAREKLKVLERRANRKMKRLYRDNKADIRGTKYDPTRGADRNRLTLKQVQARIARIEQFNSRKTQYYGDASGRLLSQSAVREYKRAIRRSNYESRQLYKPFKNLVLPDHRTVETRHKFRREQHFASLRGRRGAVNDLSSPRPMSPSNFVSEKALKKYTEKLNEKIGHQYEHNLSLARDNFADMIKIIGDEELEDRVNQLSDQQFYALWYHTNFVNELKELYAIAYARANVRGADKWKLSGVEMAEQSVYSHVEWASRKFVR